MKKTQRVPSRSPPASDFYSVASGDTVFAGGEQIQVTRQRRATATLRLEIAHELLYLCICMRPDYPHKIFDDKRHNYCLLMEALAMTAPVE